MPEMSEERERRICEAWDVQAKFALEAKKNFCTCAAEAMRFYAQPNHNFMFEGSPDFKVTINKVYELVSIYGPHLYGQDPVRNATPRRFGKPALAQIFDLLLNYTPSEFGLKMNSEEAISDALISGRGVMFTGIDRKSGFPITVQESSANIFVDPSQRKWYDGYFIMRVRRDVPLWKIARMFGKDKAKRLAEGEAGRGNEFFGFFPSLREDTFDAEEKTGEPIKTYDAPRATYVEVYSKMGVGPRGVRLAGDDDAYLTGEDGSDNTVIVYVPKSNVILHLGDWPIPFWADHGAYSWPTSFFDPGENRDRTWPISIITPALGEQRWLNWGASYMLAQTKTASRNIFVAGSDIPPGLENALKGNKNWIVAKADRENPDDIGRYLQRIELPEISAQFIEMLRYAEDLFEKRTGLYEIMYGQSRKQYRSATEASLKGQYTQARIDAVVDRVERWQAQIARKEAIAARWLLSAEQLLPIVGPELAQQWQGYQKGDLENVIREFDYRVVPGSMAKQTPRRRAAIASERLERFGPLWMQTNNLQALNEAIKEWEAANGNPHPEKYAIQQMPPPEEEEEEKEPPAPQEVIAIEGGQPVFGTPEAAA